nr:response regulator [Azospirillum sp. INR13]
MVEDEFGIATVLGSILEEEGYHVLVAANGQQALSRLAEAPAVPDLVVTDYMMPLLDGVGLARALRDEAAWQNIPIVMMSALPEAAVRQEFDDYRAFLRKPFSIPAFLHRVTTILEEEQTDAPAAPSAPET